MKKHLIIAVDGGNGAGKTTLLDKLYKHLSYTQSRYIERISELNDNELGRDVKKLLTKHNLSNTTEIAMICALRNEILNTRVKQIRADNDKTGTIMLYDRYSSSTYAFQVHPHDRYASAPLFNSMCSAELGYIPPDIEIILNIDVELSKTRIRGRGKELDWKEGKDTDYLKKAHGGFNSLADSHIIDVTADKTPDDIFNEARIIIDKEIQWLG